VILEVKDAGVGWGGQARVGAVELDAESGDVDYGGGDAMSGGLGARGCSLILGFGCYGEFEVAEIGEEAVEAELGIADVFEFYVGFVDFGGGIDGIAASTSDDVGSLRGLASDGNGAGDALIDVGVAGKNGVGIEAGGGAGRVDGVA
jgi:hypothetical protein